MAAPKGKKTEEQKPTPAATTAVAPKAKPGALQLEGVSDHVLEALKVAEENMKAVDNFKLPRTKITGEGFELAEGAEPVKELSGVLVFAKKTNVYYDKPYKKGDVSPPRCYSIDGETPVADLHDKDGKALKPIHPTCDGCPMAEFGTNAMGSGKACRNLKPIYLVRKTENGISIVPRQITVTPTSLKAANAYFMDLTEMGFSYRNVVTTLTAFKKDADDKYSVLKFKLGTKLTDQEKKDVEAIRAQWLPAMATDIVDQNELDKEQAPATVASSQGEY